MGRIDGDAACHQWVRAARVTSTAWHWQHRACSTRADKANCAYLLRWSAPSVAALSQRCVPVALLASIATHRQESPGGVQSDGPSRERRRRHPALALGGVGVATMSACGLAIAGSRTALRTRRARAQYRRLASRDKFAREAILGSVSRRNPPIRRRAHLQAPGHPWSGVPGARDTQQSTDWRAASSTPTAIVRASASVSLLCEVVTQRCHAVHIAVQGILPSRSPLPSLPVCMALCRFISCVKMPCPCTASGHPCASGSGSPARALAVAFKWTSKQDLQSAPSPLKTPLRSSAFAWRHEKTCGSYSLWDTPVEKGT